MRNWPHIHVCTHTNTHSDLHAGSVVCPCLTSQACNEALEKVCSKAAAVVQISLRSHSDNRLAFSCFPKPRSSVTGWDGWSGDLIQLSEGRRFWLGPLQMWWVWDTKLGRHLFGTARGQRAAFLLLCPSSPGERMFTTHSKLWKDHEKKPNVCKNGVKMLESDTEVMNFGGFLSLLIDKTQFWTNI